MARTLLAVGGSIRWDRTASPPDYAAPGRVQIDGPETAPGEISWAPGIQLLAGALVTGTTLEPQTAYLELRVDGAAVARSTDAAAWEVVRSIDDPASWQVLHFRWLDEPPADVVRPGLGSIMQYHGAPPGLRLVDLVGVYISEAGTKVSVPLISSGVADSADETVTEEGGFLSAAGLDSWGCYDEGQGLVTLSLLAGHNTRRGAVVRQVAIAAGVPAASVDVDGGRRANKSVELVYEPGLPWARDYLLDSEARYLGFDAAGALVARRFGPAAARPVDWVIDEAGISLAGGIQLTGLGSVPTRICITGTRQPVLDACGLRVERTTAEEYTVWAPTLAVFSQLFSGALSATGASQPTAALVRTSLVIVDRHLDCDTEVVVRTRRWAYRNPLTWRYTLDIDEAVSGYNAGVFILEAGAVQDDQTEAYYWDSERWVLEEDHVVVSDWDDETGLLTSRTTYRAGWLLRERALRVRAGPSTPWDTAPILSPGRVTGSRTPIGSVFPATFSGMAIPAPDNTEWLTTGLWTADPDYPGEPPVSDAGSLEIVVEVPEVDASGRYKVGDRTSERRYVKRRGSAYLYADGSESRDEEVALLVDRVTSRTYLPEGEASHSEIRSASGRDGVTERLEIDTALVDYLPAAEKRTDAGASGSGGSSASTEETVDLELELSVPGLELLHKRHDLIESSEWSESEADLEDVAIDILRRGSAVTVTLELLGAHWLIREGDRLVVHFPRLELGHDAYVVSVTWRKDEDGPIVTVVEAEIYAF